MALEIVALCEQHLESAAALVAASYRALRQTLPELDPAHEQADSFLPPLRNLVASSPGVVAVRDGRVCAFMTGSVIPELLGKRCAYSPEWANAADDPDGRLLYEEMYARLSAQWVADGCHLHAVTLMASQLDGITALQWFGFGHANVDAVRGLAQNARCGPANPAKIAGRSSGNAGWSTDSELTPVEGARSAVIIRQAGPGDLDSVMELSGGLERHMAGPPIFWIHDERDYSAWLREPGNVLWLAFDGARCLGMLGVQPDDPGLLILRDPRTAHVVAVFAAEPARRTGVATALLNHALQWARANGYERCHVDFETANYVAARFWLKRFKPVAYSLLRWIPD
jgi:GNAT superfamily N-acetyltransferase